MKPTARSMVLIVALAAALPAIPVRTVHATGTTYYVDPAGNDGNTGDGTHPFQHIQQCATVMLAGDSCTINAGTYREKVTPAHSGTATSPITYQPAPGAAVRVDGTDYVNSWSAVTSSDVATLAAGDSRITGSPFANAVSNGVAIYKAHVTLSSPPAANQLFVGDTMQSEAQWPDPSADPLTPTVELAGAGTTTTNIADAKLTQASGYWNGAHIYIQQKFTAATGDVTSFQSGNLSVTGYYGTYPDHFDLCEGAGAGDTRFFLWGRITELNAPSEWYYDSTSSTLYFVPTGGAAPATNTVTMKQRSLAFDLAANNVSYTTISGLQTFGSTIQTGDSSTGDTLTGLTVSYPSHVMTISKDPNQVTSASCDNLGGGDTTTGIMVRGTGNTVQNSTIQHSAGNGVALIGSGNTVTNNVIHDVDYSGGRPAGVYLLGDNQVITHNTIYNLGRGGIESNNNFAPAHLHADDISFNDIYSYGRLEQDDGGIYVCCNMDMSGTVIHHNWVHDAQTYPGVPNQGTIGIYIDGGTQGGTNGLTIYNNVGWNNASCTVGLVTSPVNNTKVLSNDGGVFLSGITSSSNSVIRDNIGDVTEGNGTTAGIVPNDHNLVALNTPGHDPLYVDAGAANYTLGTGSPAILAGTTASPGTDGAVESPPSEGAYQHGVAAWQQPGASTMQTIAIRPQWGGASLTYGGDWSASTQGNPVGRMDSHPAWPYALMFPGAATPTSGTLHYTLTTPAANGHTIDRVYVRLYARMHHSLSSNTVNTTLTVPGLGTIFDATGKDFESVGVPVSLDITSQVAGNWANIPTSADVYGTMGVEPQPGPAGPYSIIQVYALEIYVQAH
jgi:hypothetical protein